MNTNKNRAVGKVLYQKEISFKAMVIIQDKEKHAIMIIWLIIQESIKILKKSNMMDLIEITQKR